MRHIYALALLSLPLLAANVATAQDQVRERDPTGTRLGSPIATSTLYPLTKTWDKFTPAEQANFRKFYENLGEGDEPPFPLHGMTEIVRQVSELASRTGYSGELRMHILVGADGKAKSVSFLKYTNLEAAKSVAKALVMARYKPGVCSGSPCEMAFPFYIVMRLW